MDIGSGVNGISPTAFNALTWIFFVVCTIAFIARAYIRYVCFHRLLAEDYLMLLALAMHNSQAVLAQIYANQKAFVAVGICINLSMIGILIVKINFLLFFRRIGANIGERFNVMCPVEYIFYSGTCTSTEGLRKTMIQIVFSAVQDALSDFLIIGFPVSILWKSGIGLRKKRILTFLFGLVSFTIFHMVLVLHRVQRRHTHSLLFVNRDQKAFDRIQESQRREALQKSVVRRRWQNQVCNLHDSVIDRCRELEESDWIDTRADILAIDVPSGLMMIDFNKDNSWTRAAPITTTEDPMNSESIRRSISTQSLLRN
ncbi:hypothetical protein N8I77_011565 [Diaporthe amygdali]|uniref:Integral membrane protein n=1 Tax=Phomopsis amygdali TaxID=1214568 RepID=A0AAD9S8K2_PHOAM|nr:hypothetical protein N8I77_011565 [Diaporthe amygdali]